MSLQPGLFDAAPGADRTTIRFPPNLQGYKQAVRRAFGQGLPPHQVWWVEDYDANTESQDSNLSLPREFAALARFVACHSAPDRWALMYEVIWRLKHDEPHLLSLSGDPLIRRLRNYDKSVHRDYHKMKAFVRFKKVAENHREQYVAWFEPEHHIVELCAEFFVKRFTNMHWSVLTPLGCAHWHDGTLSFTAGLKDAYKPEDNLDELWRTYYKNIFNPARIKLDAMRAEMPQKYWQHLPEAELIPALVLGADQRVDQMISSQPKEAILHCGERPASYQSRLQATVASNESMPLERLNAAIKQCDRCEICQHATQPVSGEGNLTAHVMLVGEQPGDQEDLAGRPFVGPAGQLLDDVLKEVGIQRQNLYVTNAVKGFRFRAAGRRRIHEKPREGHIHACKPWLEREIAEVNPDMIVCLGATATQALLGTAAKFSDVRGKIFELGRRLVLPTLHPAAILRSGGAGQMRVELSQSLALAAALTSQSD